MGPGKMMVATGLALYGTSCFVQPGQQPAHAPAPADVAQVSVQQGAANAGPEDSAQSSNWESIAAGVALGLVVGLAGAAAPAKAAGGPLVVGMFEDKNDRCVVKEGCVGEKLQKWAKRMITKEEEIVNYKQDPKYSQASTGVGVYKRYGLDYASPIKGNGYRFPGEGYNGEYLIHERRHPWTGYFDYPEGFDEKFREQTKGIIGKQGFTWQNAPYKWDKSMWEK